jgi:hypothetical protein
MSTYVTVKLTEWEVLAIETALTRSSHLLEPQSTSVLLRKLANK